MVHKWWNSMFLSTQSALIANIRFALSTCGDFFISFCYNVHWHRSKVRKYAKNTYYILFTIGAQQQHKRIFAIHNACENLNGKIDCWLECTDMPIGLIISIQYATNIKHIRMELTDQFQRDTNILVPAHSVTMQKIMTPIDALTCVAFVCIVCVSDEQKYQESLGFWNGARGRHSMCVTSARWASKSTARPIHSFIVPFCKLATKAPQIRHDTLLSENKTRCKNKQASDRNDIFDRRYVHTKLQHRSALLLPANMPL